MHCKELQVRRQCVSAASEGLREQVGWVSCMMRLQVLAVFTVLSKQSVRSSIDELGDFAKDVCQHGTQVDMPVRMEPGAQFSDGSTASF